VVADFTWFGCPELEHLRPPSGHWDVCITNPPFCAAWEYVKTARQLSTYVAMLLRLNWLEGRKRQPAVSTPPSAWLRLNTPDTYVLPDRPSFDQEGTDATAYSWMVWSPWSSGRLHILDETPRALRRGKPPGPGWVQSPGEPWACCSTETRHDRGEG